MFDSFLKNNDFFNGGFALLVMGGIVAALSRAPSLIWKLIQRKWMVSVTMAEVQKNLLDISGDALRGAESRRKENISSGGIVNFDIVRQQGGKEPVAKER